MAPQLEAPLHAHTTLVFLFICFPVVPQINMASLWEKALHVQIVFYVYSPPKWCTQGVVEEYY